MKALSVQVQPHRATEMDVSALGARFNEIAQNIELVKHHQFDRGHDKVDCLNFTFDTEDLGTLWLLIQEATYRDRELGTCMRAASLAVCEGERGWDDYRLLYHWDPAVKRDAL